MKTNVNKHMPRPFEHVINEDGMAWTVEYPPRELILGKKYSASIPDRRLDHCSFEDFGYHHVWGDTMEELLNDLKELDVPYYSSDSFFRELKKKDSEDERDDRQVELYYDGRGARITRGELTYENMTAYTSL